MTTHDILHRLSDTLASRRHADPETSYTARLFSRGRQQIAKKLGEEAVETVIAAIGNDRENLVYESADVLYHLMVVLKIADIPLKAVLDELQRRTVQTGLSEKASRQDP